MREILVVFGLVVLAIGLRSSRTRVVRKLGALTFLVATYVAVALLCDCWWLGVLGVIPWFFLPWIELLTRVKNLRLPMDNRLRHVDVPDPEFFPNAPEAAMGMDDAGFEQIGSCGWDWAGMHQHLQLFWHPEERAEAAICMCEQSNVAFSFITITSRDSAGRILRTTNFPFSPTLKCPAHLHWNHVPCERNVFGQILQDHHRFLERLKVDPDSLMIPDPDAMEEAIEAEMKCQLNHNLKEGIIRPAADERYFEYSARGLFFLWKQAIKDMVRLC